MAAPQQFSLRWNNYSQHIVTALEDLRSDDELVDVTLSCEGQRIRCHKVLLSACSTYFRETFKDNPCKHPTIIIKGVSFLDLEAVVTFMYNGQVNVSQDRLPTFLSAAEYLQIKGLTDMNDKEEPAAKKRTLPNHNLSNANAPGASRSGSGTSTPDNVQRPPSPKRKRMIPGESLNMKSMAQPTPNPANEPKSQNENGPSNNNNDHDHHSHDPFAPDVSIKYEDGDDDDATGLSVEDHDGSQDDMMMEGSGMGFGSSSGAGLGASGNDSSHDIYENELFDESDYSGPFFGNDDEVAPKLTAQTSTVVEDRKPWISSPIDSSFSATSSSQIPQSFLSTVPNQFPFMCPFPNCGKIYKCMSSYSEHKRFHLGYFKCVFCNKQLSKKTHLNRHLKNVHHVTLQGPGWAGTGQHVEIKNDISTP